MAVLLGFLIAGLAGWKSYDLAAMLGRFVGRRLLGRAFAHDVDRAMRATPVPGGDP